MAKRGVSTRQSLLRSFLALILLSSLTALVLTSIRARETELQLSAELIERATGSALVRLEGLFKAPVQGTLLGVGWGRGQQLELAPVVSGAAGAETPDQLAWAGVLNARLLPYLDLNPLLSSVQIANSRGQGFLLLRQPDGALVNRVVAREWGARALWIELDALGRAVEAEWRDTDYDPRTREWYTALENARAGVVQWTQPYLFFTTGDLGITASAWWSEGETRAVVAWDVLLTDLTDFTQSPAARVTPNSQMLITTQDFRLLGLPLRGFETEQARRAGYLEPVLEMKDPLFAAAVAARAEHRRSGASPEETPVTEFEHADDPWWTGIGRYELSETKALFIAIMIPNADLLSDVSATRQILVGATLAAVVAALLYSILLARSYSRPLEALVEHSKRIQEFDFESPVGVEAGVRELRDLADAQDQSMKALESFSRYVPMGVVRQLVQSGEVARIGGEERRLTILFTDIVGFTSVSERMSPQELTEHMARYLQVLIDALQESGATIDKLVGDAVIAFWGAPTAIPERALVALGGVVEARSRLDALNKQFQHEDRPVLRTRFGLSTGDVIVGNIGAPSRLSYTALGDAMNTASRLEGLNKGYGTEVLVDRDVREAAEGAYEFRFIDRVVVVGRSEPTEIFELLGARGSVAPALLQSRESYERAWHMYAAREFAGAAELLERHLETWPEDAPAFHLLGECRGFAASPPDPDWDGRREMREK